MKDALRHIRIECSSQLGLFCNKQGEVDVVGGRTATSELEARQLVLGRTESFAGCITVGENRGLTTRWDSRLDELRRLLPIQVGEHNHFGLELALVR